MSKNSTKRKSGVRKEIAARHGAIDVFLNGVPAVSIWSTKSIIVGLSDKLECKVFEALNKNDFQRLAWGLTKIAAVLMEYSKEKELHETGNNDTTKIKTIR